MPRPSALMGLLLAVFVGGCTRAPTPAQGDAQPPAVVLQLRSGVEVRVTVEIARSEGERARGLMFRRSLDPGTGMLFLFPRPDRLKFWMRNTYIPLDMIFLDEERRVVYVEEGAEPLTEQPRGPDTLSQFVLEVPAGWARAHGVEPGVTARFIGVP